MRSYRSLVLSNHWSVRVFRRLRAVVDGVSIPAPKSIVGPILAIRFLLKYTWYFFYRVFVCEPLFKFHCQVYGKNLHTGAFIHDVYGTGAIIIGDNVTIDGKCTFSFALRFSDKPTLTIGDDTGIGYGCHFTVGKGITIGRDCRIGKDVYMFDSPGHPLNPERRKAGQAVEAENVRPIHIGDNVWIGVSAIIFPGVTIGDNSVVGSGAVVMSDVPVGVVVLGNPARGVLSVRQEGRVAAQ